MDNKYIKILNNKLESLYLKEGKNYLEFKKTVESLLDDNNIELLLEENKFSEKDAFIYSLKVLKIKDLSKEDFIESLNFCIQEIEKEKELFKQSQIFKYDKNVSKIEKELKELKEYNHKLKNDIIEINKQININEKTIIEKDNIKNNNSIQIEENQKEFEKSFYFFIENLKQDENKINTYLINTK